jgi:hypothetical protein
MQHRVETGKLKRLYKNPSHPFWDLLLLRAFMDIFSIQYRMTPNFAKLYLINNFQFVDKHSLLEDVVMRSDNDRLPWMMCSLGQWNIFTFDKKRYECKNVLEMLATWMWIVDQYHDSCLDFLRTNLQKDFDEILEHEPDCHVDNINNTTNTTIDNLDNTDYMTDVDNNDNNDNNDNKDNSDNEERIADEIEQDEDGNVILSKETNDELAKQMCYSQMIDYTKYTVLQEDWE